MMLMVPDFYTTFYAVVTASKWQMILDTLERHYEEMKPYTENPYACFNGRFVVVVETIGL